MKCLFCLRCFIFVKVLFNVQYLSIVRNVSHTWLSVFLKQTGHRYEISRVPPSWGELCGTWPVFVSRSSVISLSGWLPKTRRPALRTGDSDGRPRSLRSGCKLSPGKRCSSFSSSAHSRETVKCNYHLQRICSLFRNINSLGNTFLIVFAVGLIMSIK